MRENGIEVNLAKTKNVKLAEQTVGLESGASIFQMGDAPSVEELAKDKAREEFNNQVDEYVDKLNQHQELLDKYKEEVIGDLNKLEIFRRDSYDFTSSIGNFKKRFAKRSDSMKFVNNNH